MVGKLILLAILAVCSSPSLFACDACGCSSSFNNMGLLTNYRINVFALGHSTAKFRGDPSHGFGSEDLFHTTELSLRQYFGPRWKLLAHLPYKHNIRMVSDQQKHISGLSDLRLLAGYTIIQDRPMGEFVKLFLESSVGMQVPTGKYDARIHVRDLPENFNTGFGSWAFLQQNNLVISQLYYGIILNTNFMINGTSSSGYSFGDQFSGNLLTYYEKRFTGNFSIIPNIGLSYERISKDQYVSALDALATGGEGLFTTGGLNIKWDNLMMGAALHLPVSGRYAQGEVNVGPRMSIQLTYQFMSPGNAKS